MAETNGVGLSEDLLIEILTRLPLKCFYRLKCVSKSWRRLISDDYAAGKLPLITSGVFYRYSFAGGEAGERQLQPRYACSSEGSFRESNLGYLPFHQNSSIIDCSNGLLLFHRSLPPAAFYVCNPTTKRWVELPHPKNRSQLSIIAFDPYHSPDYKVLCFSGWEAKGGSLEVFSSATGRWSEHRLQWGIETDKLSASMHYFNGVLHLLAHPRHFVAIDLGEMSCSITELPEEMKKDACLGSSGGSLHYAMNDGEEVRIWVLGNDSESGLRWILKGRIGIGEIVEWFGGSREMCSSSSSSSSFPLFHGYSSFLAFHPKEEIGYLWVMGNLVSYDLGKKRLGLVCELGKEKEKEKAQMIQIWLFPFANYVPDCLA